MLASIFVSDVRHGARLLAKNRWLTAAAVLSLALGVDADISFRDLDRRSVLLDSRDPHEWRPAGAGALLARWARATVGRGVSKGAASVSDATEVLGWASSVVLVLTIGAQIHKQWKAGTSEGVSKWLFLGQVAASTGFTLYSWLVGNWVFVATNALMLVSAFVGLAVVLIHRRRKTRR